MRRGTSIEARPPPPRVFRTPPEDSPLAVRAASDLRAYVSVMEKCGEGWDGSDSMSKKVSKNVHKRSRRGINGVVKEWT